MREMIPVLIVAIVMIAAVFKYRYRYLGNQNPPEAAGENRQLRDEVQQLKERIKVLERIAVDKENVLAKEIDSLRDR